MTMQNEYEVVIIGGGVTGLCAGWYAAQRFGRDKVLVLEAGNRPGGTTGTDLVDGYRCDWGSNGFLDREPKTLEWVTDLGLDGELVRANNSAKKRFIYRSGRLFEIKPPPAFLASPLLSLPGRLRLCCEPFIPAKRDNLPESIHAFAARRIGREAADMLVGPMVSGVFGGDAHQLSLEHCFPRMAAMERQYGGLVKALIAKKKENTSVSPTGPSGILTSFRQGVGSLIDTAANQLGDSLRLGCRVMFLEKMPEGYRLALESGKSVTARAVIMACPAYAAASLVGPLAESAANALNAIPYAGITVVCTGYNRTQIAHPLDGFGFLVPRNQGLRLLGCLWTSSLFPNQAGPDKVLLRTMVGGATDPDGAGLSDDALLELVKGELHPLLGLTGVPELMRIFRHPRGIPQYTLGHGERLKAVEAAESALPGLLFAGNAYRGIGLNDCVLSAHRALEHI